MTELNVCSYSHLPRTRTRTRARRIQRSKLCHTLVQTFTFTFTFTFTSHASLTSDLHNLTDLGCSQPAVARFVIRLRVQLTRVIPDTQEICMGGAEENPVSRELRYMNPYSRTNYSCPVWLSSLVYRGGDGCSSVQPDPVQPGLTEIVTICCYALVT